MENIQIEVKLDSFNKRKNITGIIYFKFNDYSFPYNDWNDFPLNIIGFWMQSISDLSNNNKADFLFMDGPYRLEVIKNNNNILDIYCIDGHSDKVTYQTRVQFNELINELIIVSDKIIKFIELKEWNDFRTDGLKNYLEKFRNQYNYSEGITPHSTDA